MTDVLLIDHSPTALSLLLRHLDDLGLRARIARDATTGLGAFLQLRPDLTLVDMSICCEGNGPHGLAVLRRIRSWDPAAHVAILAADPAPLRVARTLEMGAAAVLTKPVPQTDLTCLCDRLGLATDPMAALA